MASQPARCSIVLMVLPFSSLFRAPCGAEQVRDARPQSFPAPATPRAAAPGQPPAAPAQPPVAPAAPPTSAPVAPAGPAATSIPPAGIANSQSSKNPDLRCDLMEVKRVSGGALLIKWRLVNVSAQAKTLQYYSGWNVHPPPEALYYIDPAENKKYSHLTDTDGRGIEDLFQGDIPPGEQRGSWAKFPAPPATSAKISVDIPDFPRIPPGAHGKVLPVQAKVLQIDGLALGVVGKT